MLCPKAIINILIISMWGSTWDFIDVPALKGLRRVETNICVYLIFYIGELKSVCKHITCYQILGMFYHIWIIWRIHLDITMIRPTLFHFNHLNFVCDKEAPPEELQVGE